MTPRLPQVVGHRGAAAHAPENTLPGIRAAAAMGIGAVEVDVKLTKDGELVLIHDDRVDRTTDGSGAVRDLTLAQLRALDAGTWLAPQFSGTTIPTLAEAIAEILALGLQVNLEIKPCPDRERETARDTVAAVANLWPRDKPWPLISSFAEDALDTAMREAPDQPRAVLMESGSPQEWTAATARLDAVAMHGNARAWTPAHVAAVKSAGLACGCYTVNDPAQAIALQSMGLDYQISDDPAVIAAAFASGR